MVNEDKREQHVMVVRGYEDLKDSRDWIKDNTERWASLRTNLHKYFRATDKPTMERTLDFIKANYYSAGHFSMGGFGGDDVYLVEGGNLVLDGRYSGPSARRELSIVSQDLNGINATCDLLELQDLRIDSTLN